MVVNLVHAYRVDFHRQSRQWRHGKPRIETHRERNWSRTIQNRVKRRGKPQGRPEKRRSGHLQLSSFQPIEKVQNFLRQVKLPPQTVKTMLCYKNICRLSFSRNLLKELTLIGRGEFGDVMLGKVLETALSKRSSGSSQDEAKDLPVLVKVLSQTKDDNCLAEFKREIDMFSKLNHEHITRLFGLCREQEPHYLIMEHTEWVSKVFK